MKVVIFGATGMVGQGVLRECLAADDVDHVTCVGRTAPGVTHAKLSGLAVPDMMNVRSYQAELQDFDACFFCLGVSSFGMTEADYTRITTDLTLAIAEVLARLNPRMTFIYISGAGTDSSEHGRSMWARVKGRTENALLRLAFQAVYLFRPGIIEPLHGIRSRTAAYRLLYPLLKPLLPLLRWFAPNQVLTTESIGWAMLAVARGGWPRPVLEAADIAAAARGK